VSDVASPPPIRSATDCTSRRQKPKNSKIDAQAKVVTAMEATCRILKRPGDVDDYLLPSRFFVIDFWDCASLTA